MSSSVEDYQALLSACNKVELDGDEGVLLSLNEKFLYFKEGEYWTSSYQTNEVGEIIPIHIKVSKGSMKFSTSYKESKMLFIMSVVK